MKVLFVASYNKGHYAPFIDDQAEALRKYRCEVEIIGVVGKGARGYLSCLNRIKNKIEEYKPDIIHAHYGLSGLLANLQRCVPVVTTYHGSDINDPKVLPLSKIAIKLSSFNIFVSKKNVEIACVKQKYAIIPCGVDMEVFKPMQRIEARKVLEWSQEGKKALFAGAFDNPIKRPEIAKKAVDLIEGLELVEMKGYSRSDVALLMNACDVLVLTSKTEGSPQVIKEAMACGMPIVSVDVGDVAEMVTGIKGCYISNTDAIGDVTENLRLALEFKGYTEGRERIESLGLANNKVAERLYQIYNEQ